MEHDGEGKLQTIYQQCIFHGKFSFPEAWSWKDFLPACAFVHAGFIASLYKTIAPLSSAFLMQKSLASMADTPYLKRNIINTSIKFHFVPPTLAIAGNRPFKQVWPPGGPWRNNE
jgi:hypothetical protein